MPALRWLRPHPAALAALFSLFASAAAAQSGTITPGQSISGQLRSSDPMLTDSTYYHQYTYVGSPGDQVVITLRSSDFDAYLMWGRISGGQFIPDTADDDSGGGLDSQISATVGDGTWAVIVNTIGTRATGQYVLSVQRSGGAAPAGGGATPAGSGAGEANPEVRAIAAGQTAEGRFQGGDPTLDDGSHFHLYLYEGSPGEQIVVTMRSSSFDAFLLGGPIQNGDFEQRDRDDDGGGGTDARLTVTLDGVGSYAILANSYGAGETGEYTLQVESLQTRGTTSGSSVIRAGETVAGKLTSADETLDDDSHFQVWQYQGQAGERVSIALSSGEFDAMLMLARDNQGEVEMVANDDDGGSGTNSLIEATLPVTGSYMIVVNSYGAGETGAYTLSVSAAGEGAGAFPTVALGQSVAGQLTPSDPTLADNSHFKMFVYRGQPGEQILVTLRSSEFDAFLSGGQWVGGELRVVDSDDDGAGGTDAQILGTVGPDGTYAIRANSFTGGATGRFTLLVEPLATARRDAPANPTGAATMAADTRVQGVLRDTDPVLGDESHFHQYIYDGNPGDRIRITLQSNDFDAFLRWGRVDGGQWVSDAFDDDGAGGTDSQLEVTVSGTGVYAIQANTYDGGQTGAYTLTVERLSAAPIATTPTPTATAPDGRAGKWLIQYVDSPNPTYRGLSQEVKQMRPLEMFSDELNAALPLHRDLRMRFDECGMVNAYYNPRDGEIVFCYEMVQLLAGLFVPDGQWTQEQREAVNGAIRFILWHEVGHALVGELDLPVTGMEEDAVDQLAAWMLLSGGEKGASDALNGVLALQDGGIGELTDWHFAGEHSLPRQRLFNVLCWIYGSDPQKYAGIRDDEVLPENRAVRCPYEYDRVSKAWARILSPFVVR